MTSQRRSAAATPRRARSEDLAGPAERAGLICWVPVWMSVGIGLWFALPFQPGFGANLGAAVVGIVGAALWYWRLDLQAGWRLGGATRLIGFALLAVAVGFGLSSLRAHRVAGPVLEFRYYGAIEGRVTGIDRSARDRIRLTLDQVRLERVPDHRLPRKLRLSLPDGVTEAPAPGTRVMLTGHLGPPPGPAEPGGFDFRRAAWFSSLGAIGYTRTPVLTVAPPGTDGAMRLHRLRMRVSAAMQERIGGQAGAVSSALMTGDRSGISEETNQMMRDSNLYHIISISGLHMAMLGGFVFSALRLLIVAGQAVSGRCVTWPAHKLAAGGGIAAAASYLWLSGGGVATERAFLMVAVMMGAILADRRALSLRTVALAAAVILALAPEALLTPGFQMSFAATIALIVSFRPWHRLSARLPWLLRPVVMLIASSVVAGFATSPIAALHFGRMAHYGVLANLLVVPATGVLIMPMGPIAALLAPFGLEAPALWLMGLGTSWMLAVGTWIAGLKGSVSLVIQPGPLVLPLLAIGATMAVLGWRSRAGWRGNWRGIGGILMVAAGFAAWLNVSRPQMLISQAGDAVGVMTPQGRALPKPKGGSFTVREWLEKDGDMVSQEEAAARPGWEGPVKMRQTGFAGVQVWHLTGKGSAEAVPPLCQGGAIIVSDQAVDKEVTSKAGAGGACQLFDLNRLRRTGAVAMIDGEAGLRVVTTKQVTGRRPWSY